MLVEYTDITDKKTIIINKEAEKTTAPKDEKTAGYFKQAIATTTENKVLTSVTRPKQTLVIIKGTWAIRPV